MTAQLSASTWRARALRYILIYLLLACALVTLRFQTRDTYQQLRDIRQERTDLQRQRDELSVEVQGLTSEQRVRDWALANGMQTYAQAPKSVQVLPSVPLPADLPPPPPHPAPLEVTTRWK
ncbi:cell division protein FtsL [Deinococcus sonorensis]|uniref:Cell division protein FtsL n=1 Tax=Deinococcus sonorensis TaxID=309891 RepID=A0ABV8YAW7_9DEIO